MRISSYTYNNYIYNYIMVYLEHCSGQPMDGLSLYDYSCIMTTK